MVDEDTIYVSIKLKTACKSESLPVLRLPSYEDWLIIETDASDTTWGAVLKFRKKLENEDTDIDKCFGTDELLCRYAGGTFTETEQRWMHSFTKE